MPQIILNDTVVEEFKRERRSPYIMSREEDDNEIQSVTLQKGSSHHLEEAIQELKEDELGIIPVRPSLEEDTSSSVWCCCRRKKNS